MLTIYRKMARVKFEYVSPDVCLYFARNKLLYFSMEFQLPSIVF